MTTNLQTRLSNDIENAAQKAGLTVVSSSEGKDLNGEPTAIFILGLATHTDRSLQLELSHNFDFNKPELVPAITEHLAAAARRLRNPNPNVYVTRLGLPISYSGFAWPFHRSTSGADTYIVHGEITLADGNETALHAKVSASMTVTFAEIVPAPEQPYAEDFIYNAVRKTLDQGQLEFVKSGNRQPVPVTTRYYSRWKKAFTFTDSDAQSRMDFVLLKTYWLSGVLAGSAPVWIADPQDAQYLNTTPEELLTAAKTAASQGLITLNGDMAAATPQLLARKDAYQAQLEKAITLTKPSFNEKMRAGETNM